MNLQLYNSSNTLLWQISDGVCDQYTNITPLNHTRPAPKLGEKLRLHFSTEAHSNMKEWLMAYGYCYIKNGYQYWIDGVGGTITNSTQSASAAWTYDEYITVPTNLLSYCPGVELTSIFIVIDYGFYDYGSTPWERLGRTTCLIPSASDGIQITSKSIVENTANLATAFGGFVQNKSQLKVSVNTKTFYRSTTKSVVVNFNGTNYSCSISNVASGTNYTCSTSVTIPVADSGTFPVKITVADSFGYSATQTQNITIYPYVNPSISKLTVQRCLANGTLNDEGTCAKIEFAYNVASVNSKNTKSFVVQYYNGSSWVDLHRNTTDYTGTSSFVSPAVFDVNSSHQVRAVVSDYFTSGTVTRTIDPSFALINFGAGGHSIAFGGQSANAGAFQCFLPADFTKNVAINHLTAGNLVVNNANTFSNMQYSGAGTSGTAGYCCIARFTFTSQYANKPITFDVAGRGRDRPYHCSFQMNNIQYAANLTLKCAYCDNYLSAVPVYIKSCGSGVFEIYVQKSEAWDTVSLENLHYDINYMKITISYPNTHVTSVSGMTQFGPIATYLTSGNFTSYAPRAVNTMRMVRGTVTFTTNASGHWDYWTAARLNSLLGISSGVTDSNVVIASSMSSGGSCGCSFCWWPGSSCYSFVASPNGDGILPKNSIGGKSVRLNYVIIYFGA